MKQLVFLILLIYGSHLYGQSNIDSLLDALPVAQDTNRLIAIDAIVTRVRSTDKALAQRLINEEYELARMIGIERFTAGVHNSHAVFQYFQSEIDSAIFYFEKALFIFKEIGNRKKEAAINNNIGLIYGSKGDFETSTKYYIASLKIKEEIDDQLGIAKTNYNIANNWIELGQYDRAKSNLNEAYNIFRELELPDELNDIIYSKAAIASNQDSFHLALKYYKQSLAYSKSIDQGYDVLGAMINIGQSYEHLLELDSSLHYYSASMDMALSFEDQESQALLYRHIGQIYSHQGRHQEAIDYIDKSVALYSRLGYSDYLADSYQYLYQVQERARQYEKAYYSFEKHILLRDSIASKKMQTDVIELETKYETEKKEKELALSKAEILKTESRIKLLATGLISMFLLLSALYYAMRQRAKRNKTEKEKAALEYKAVEQQLEFKKKELTAKALQLAKKNEFLQSLEHEVTELQSSVDNAVGKTSSRITRMIQRDIVDDDAWDQFGKEFSSVHQEFLNRLRDTYGSFTKGEMRLISLMRMNMTSKDIASIIGVSDQGVKKARYRVRKKMNLQPTDDIQGIIVGL